MNINITKPLPGAKIDSFNNLTNGLIGYWLMNEKTGSSVYDISGNKNQGILKNMSPNNKSSGWCGSRYGGSLSFDGTNDYINCGNDLSLNVSTGLSISAWIQPIVVTGWSTIASKLGADDLHSAIYFYIYDNKVGLRLYDNIGGQINILSSTIYINNWYHVVGTYDGSNARLYINNILVSTASSVPTINSNTNEVWIGTNVRWINEVFEGIIDNVQIHNRGIHSTEVNQLYNLPFNEII